MRLRRTIGAPDKYPLGTPKYSNQHYRGRMEINNLEGYNKLVGSESGNGIIVCGCGSSINDFVPDDKTILFGVNDINRKLKTKYLICVNEPHTFKRGRFEWIQNHTSDIFFTHLQSLAPNKREATVYFNLGARNGIAIDNIGKIDFTANSPYMAVIIAYQLGASKIALIGVDLTPNHFFGDTGDHMLSRRADDVNREYQLLGDTLINKGIKIANISSISKITSWPTMSHDEFNKL